MIVKSFKILIMLFLLLSLNIPVFAEETAAAGILEVFTYVVSPAEGQNVARTVFDITVTPVAVEENQKIDGLNLKSGISLGYVDDKLGFMVDPGTSAVRKDADGNDVISLEKATTMIDFSSVTYPSAGVYRYMVTEAPTYNYDQQFNEHQIATDTTQYIVDVYVRANTDGNLAIEYIKASDASGNKKNAIEFKQTFTSGSVSVNKVVTGNAGDRNKDYNFTVNVKSTSKTGTLLPGSLVTVKKTDQSGNVTTSTITSGTAATIQLKNGESFELTNIPILLVVDISENEYGQDGYSSTFVSNGNGVMTAKNLGTGTVSAKIYQTAPHSFTYINKKNANIPQTGINMNSTPFIVVLIAALSALLSFLVIKNQK